MPNSPREPQSITLTSKSITNLAAHDSLHTVARALPHALNLLRLHLASLTRADVRGNRLDNAAKEQLRVSVQGREGLELLL